MGQAKKRGSLEQRVAQAQSKLAATRPEKLICNSCQAEVAELHPVSTRGLRGIESIWMGQCVCGHTTFAASGDPRSVQAFFEALGNGAELRLGSQGRDGGDHETLA